MKMPPSRATCAVFGNRMTWLVIEEPYKEAELREWNQATWRELSFDQADREALK